MITQSELKKCLAIVIKDIQKQSKKKGCKVLSIGKNCPVEEARPTRLTNYKQYAYTGVINYTISLELT